jgi:hypothetical protein
MSDRPNALQMPPAPGYEDNPLMGGATLADAWDAHRQSYSDWLARDRQRQIDLGYVDPTTGQLTPEGWRAQAQTIAGGFGPADIGMAGGGLLGTIKGTPGAIIPKLTAAMRRGDQVFTGSDHLAIEREHPEIASSPDSELGFINAVGRWMPRPAAFKYALQHDLIDPNRAAEANRFYQAMDEAGKTNNLFLPSEWLRKYGIAGLMAGGAATAFGGQDQGNQ